VQAGQVVLEAGTRLGPGQLGLLAAVGRDRVMVRPRPRVVIISTGSELVEPGTRTEPGQISESNSYILTTAAREAGALAFRVGIVPDDDRSLMNAIEDQLIRADLVLTSGGVSVGAYDVVKEVLSRLGTVSFETVAMQPGKPQGYGTIGPDSTPIITLPGNPVSSYVSFEVFVRPVIRRLLGVEPLHRPVVRAVCEEAFPSPAGKRQYARGWLDVSDGRYVVRPVGGAGSHLVGNLAHANALIVVPEAVTEVPAGGTVEVMVLERRLS
jgi:molybdopterin molybdotransferase